MPRLPRHRLGLLKCDSVQQVALEQDYISKCTTPLKATNMSNIPCAPYQKLIKLLIPFPATTKQVVHIRICIRHQRNDLPL